MVFLLWRASREIVHWLHKSLVIQYYHDIYLDIYTTQCSIWVPKGLAKLRNIFAETLFLLMQLNW